ncbi:MAG TPA: PAS domain S-box protein [Burkholderiaceae bacterium]|nr:PAS domain S-box protein [Burkholderiaceae bacterium]
MNRPESVAGAPLLQPFLDLLSDAVVVLDAQARLAYVNPAAQGLLGGAAAGRLEQLQPLLGDRVLHWLRGALAGRAGGSQPQGFTLPDGRRVRLALRPIDARLWALRIELDAAAEPEAPPAARPMLHRASSELLQLVWQGPFPAMLLGTDRKLIDVNDAFVAFSGFERAELIGVDPIDLQPEEDRGAQRTARARAELEDGPTLRERRLLDASGRERRWREARQMLLDADGRALTLVTMQDCSAEHDARGRAERAARELDDWFALSPNGMVLLDGTGNLVRSNRAFDAIAGSVPVSLAEAPAALQQLFAFAGGRPDTRLVPEAAPLETEAWIAQGDASTRRVRGVVRCVETPGAGRRYLAVVEDRSIEEERDLARMQVDALMDTAGVGLATFQESAGRLRERAAAPAGKTDPGGAEKGGKEAGEGEPPAALQTVRREIVVEATLPEFEKVQQALRHTRRAEARYAIRHPELGLRWLLTRVEPATLASGKRTTSVVTLDITEQHETQSRSEQLLHEMTTILESASTGIAYLRANRLVRCNQRFEDMLGLDAGRAAGKRIDELFAGWPQLRELVAETDKALANGAGYETEFRIDADPIAGLPERWLALSLRSTGTAADAEAIAVVSDITRLKAQQSELETLARDRELMFSLSEVGIAFVRDGVIQRANEAFATLTGYAAEDILEIPFQALFPDRAEFNRLWSREDEQMRRRGRWSGERQLRRRDGQLLWVQVSKRLVVEGDPTGGMIASYVNVDARHRAEQAVALQAERTRAILDSVLVGIVTVGARGIEWMNRSARRMFGGDLADFVGQPISTVATPEPDHPFRQTQYLNELFEGQAETFECRVKARDGREFWIVGNVVATGLERTGRQLTYALLDIERRRQAEARSEETQASLQRLIEMAPLAIALRDARSLRIVQLNQTAAAIVGRPIAEIVGCTPEEMHPAGLAAEMREHMQAALAAGEVTQREYTFDSSDGPRQWDARYLPLGAPGQAPDQLLFVATDVTEQRAAQQARLDAAIAQREMLVKEVHHRIKNNLQGVAGLLQQIAERKPEVEAVISEVVGQVQAIAQVYGLQVGSSGPLLLASVVEAITGSVQRTFGRSIVFEAEGVPSRPWALPEAESIPIALTINELLTNAIKHSRADGEPVVGCHLHCDDDGVRITISNPGLLGADFKLARIPGGVSGLGLVRALMPRRCATLAIEQQGAQVQATVTLTPPGVVQLAAGV